MPRLAQLLFLLVLGINLLMVVIEAALCLAGAHGTFTYQDTDFRLAVGISLILVLSIRLNYKLLLGKQQLQPFPLVLTILGNVLGVGAYCYLLFHNIPFKWTSFSTTGYSLYGVGAVFSLGLALQAWIKLVRYGRE